MINLAHERFICEMIQHGDRLRAYKAAYPNATDKTAIVNASRLMANRAICERIRSAVRTAQQNVEYELYEQFKGQVMDTLDKRHLLYLIAEKQQTETKTVVRYNKVISWQQKPTIGQMLAAIRLDYKLSHGWKRDVDDDDEELSNY